MIDSDLYAESGGTFSSKMFNEFAFHMNTTKIKGGDDGFCNTLLVMIMFFFAISVMLIIKIILMIIIMILITVI